MNSKRSSCRDPDARHAARRERAVRRLRESDLLHDALQLHFVGSVLLALHRDRLASSALLPSNSQRRRTAMARARSSTTTAKRITGCA